MAMNRRSFPATLGTASAAVKYGPVLLAQEARFTFPLASQGDDVTAKLVREANSLQFNPTGPGGGGQPPGPFMPPYQVPERLPYRVNFDLDSPRYL
jgi:hypothetical protein